MASQRHYRNYVTARNDNDHALVSSLDSRTNGRPKPSITPLVDNDTRPTPYEHERDMVRQRFVEVSGPILFGGTDGYLGRAVCLTLGTLDCSRPPDEPEKLVHHRHSDPERSLVSIDDQHIDYHVKHYPDVVGSDRCQAMSIHQLLDHYINGELSIYPSAPSLETLDLILNFIQPEVNTLLEPVTESVALVCCNITFFDPVHRESRKILEYITIEYFYSPWSKKWNRRAKRDVVNKNVTSEADSPNNGYNGSGMNNIIPPLNFDHVRPRCCIAFSCSPPQCWSPHVPIAST
ncbi:MAG: hypothetical protein JOS17DRAFT_799356 [Linnemannia elongata]|nr:MAG: hypothetical protein JOS17DRAFT_799356 [Linnemannia elongata]